MIIQEKISINICASNYIYWKNKGYPVSMNTTHEVLVEDLLSKSNMKILCRCDSCQREYMQKYSRNKNNCSKCVTSLRMKGNTIGSKNITSKDPTKNDLMEFINKGLGKKHISEKYNVSISVVNRWFKMYKIKIDSYFGRKYFKSEKEESAAIKKIEKNFSQKINISELSRKTAIPIHILQNLKKQEKIKINSYFDIVKNEYQNIVEKLPIYVEENKKHSLKTISEKYNISIEQLKKAFSENNIKVNLHSYNKSKGEFEIKDFIINTLGLNCFSVMLEKTYEIDCFIKSHNFGIEYCEEYWHRYDPKKNNKNYHKNKYKFCKQKNINFLTIFECEWKTKRDIIESIIKSKLKLTERIYARKCHIEEIESVVACDFHDKNHISGHIKSSINIGLFYKNNLISVLSMVKSRFDRNCDYEISRFSTKLNYTVVGGLSKMFSFFVKKYNPLSCVTYSDLRFGDGKSYEKIGFDFVTQTVPNYFYIKKGNDKLESRLKYQKTKLKEMNGYDDRKTEFEIMKENNFYRLYDCGNNKFIWEKM